MEKDIENFLKWCEKEGKGSTIQFCRMSDDEIRESELYDEYKRGMILFGEYLGLIECENDSPISQNMNDHDIWEHYYKNTLLDDLMIYAGILLIFVIFPLMVSGRL